MAIADLIQTINNSRLNPQVDPVKFGNKGGIKRSGVGVTTAPVGSYQSPGSGSTLQSVLQNSKNNAQDIYTNYRSGVSSQLAQDVLSKSSGTISQDPYGIVQQPDSNYKSIATNSLATIGTIGKTALQGAEDQAYWKQLQKAQNLNVSSTGQQYDPTNLPAGSKVGNKGAEAVAIAMTAFKNHVPYIWGGNSLVNGVDCSGLMQQAYAKLGIKLPRTTYEQAKSGQIIQGGIQNAMPGDMIFYNTGSGDPNGIGKNSHVAMYIGNGMVLEAYNSKVGIREAPYNRSGTPSTIVRPWS